MKGGGIVNSYTMNSTMEVAKQASIEIEAFLRSKPETIAVINVEDDKHFQKKDIDLLWIYKFKGKEYMKRVEIKQIDMLVQATISLRPYLINKRIQKVAFFIQKPIYSFITLLIQKN